MWFDTQVASQLANEISREIAKDRMAYSLREAPQTDDVQKPRRRFNFVAAFTRLFQAPAPETHTQRRTV